MGFEQSQTLFKKLTDLIDYLIPLYVQEGKSQLVISFGCTGGKHDTVYEFSGTPAENVKKMLDLVGEELDDFNVAVRVSGAAAGIQELLDAKDEIVGCGYESYVIG